MLSLGTNCTSKKEKKTENKMKNQIKMKGKLVLFHSYSF